MSAHHSINGGGGPHVTITHDALEFTVQVPLAGPLQTWDIGTPWSCPYPLLVTFGGHHWRPIQTCSLDQTAAFVVNINFATDLACHHLAAVASDIVIH